MTVQVRADGLTAILVVESAGQKQNGITAYRTPSGKCTVDSAMRYRYTRCKEILVNGTWWILNYRRDVHEAIKVLC